MSNSTILQLRQAEASHVELDQFGAEINGHFNITLDTPQLLEEGDQVIIKACYLDTSAGSSGLINLPDPVEASINFAMYLQNYYLDQTSPFGNDATQGNLRQYPNLIQTPTPRRSTAELGDNQLYWLASKYETPDSVIWNIIGVNVTPILKHQGYATFGGCDIKFNYTPITPGAEPFSKNATCEVKLKSRYGYQKENPRRFTSAVVCLGDDNGPYFRLDPNNDGIRPHNKISTVEWLPPVVPVVATKQTGSGTFFELQEFELPITIPAGKYSPTELTETLNDLLTNAQALGPAGDIYAGDAQTGTMTRFPVMNKLLTTVLKNQQDLTAQGAKATPAVDIDQVFINATGNIIEGTTPLVNTNGQHYFKYNIAQMKADYLEGTRPAMDRWIGTNQFEFSLDAELNKIKIDIQHFPIYGGRTEANSEDAVPSIVYNNATTFPAYIAPVGANPGVIPDFIVKTGLPLRYGGIGLTGLQPSNFWKDILHFENCYIQKEQTARCKTAFGDADPGFDNSFRIENIKDGVNITGAYPGIDIGVLKNDTLYSTPVYDNWKNAGDKTSVATAATTSIFAGKSYNTHVADEGFFRVKIGNNFQQNMVGGKLYESHDTQSIVNRFYASNSFTSDQGAGSIAYTHTGKSNLLTSFKVIINDPNDDPLATSVLQEKNTIFLEIVKAIKPSPNFG